MSAFNLGFLKTLEAEQVEAAQPKTVIKDKNPSENFMGFRVWKNGSVYPSKALVEKYNLEYIKPGISQEPVMKDGQPVLDDKQQPVTERKLDFSNDNSNGIDIVDSNDWAQVKASWGNNPRLLLAGITYKRTGKVDLFAGCRYDEAGEPVLSVMDQGSSTFGKNQLLPMLKEVYNVVPGERGYIDLEIVESENLKGIAKNGIFNLPKTVIRGEKQGTPTIARRENIDIFPLIPVEQPEQVDTTLPEPGPVQEETKVEVES